MCGIFGYIGTKDADSIIINGLKQLEYRGYDSWGVTIRSDKGLLLSKHVGQIGEVKDFKLGKGTVGIGHTRWATHGEVTQKNAHPHISCFGNIAIVHNGIVENYAKLKAKLIKKGYSFSSDTDSEVIANLVCHYYHGDLAEATRRALAQVRGTYGLLVMHKDEDRLLAARNGSPLMIGLGDHEFFIASDASPIVPYTKKVVYLDDGDMAFITRDGYSVMTQDKKKLNKKEDRITWSIEEIEKGGFRHFMLKEIMGQPESMENTLRGRITDEGPHFGGLDYLGKGFLKKMRRVIITACGTSWHAALIAEYLFEEIACIPTEVEYASEFRYRNPIVDENDLVIVVSQSGETADTLAALREAKKKGAKTLGIINVVGSSIARETGGGIYLHAGPEIGVASTKAFTSQLAAMYLFIILVALERGQITPAKARELQHHINLVPKHMAEILKKSKEIRKIAESYFEGNNFLYLGRGLNYPVALEGALKLKEISYMHAEGYPAAEMKHGPIALIDEKMPVVFVAPKSGAYEKILSNMEEVKARGGKIIAVVSQEDPALDRLVAHKITIPKVHELVSPFLTVIPLQLLAYHIADLRGCDIDKPRNLAKSVTVE
ncbi:MAG: glutamine--fructose-6-phosphate transaminase (isomerizing) [Nanoarchaeota archaeon]|nr:glutamine--fructose-6-phosphate transaminase (isomerizing) [Nanoarchaeota archaeon]